MKIINWLKKVVAHPYWRSSSVTPFFVAVTVLASAASWISSPVPTALYITALNGVILMYDWTCFLFKGDVEKKQQQIEELQDYIDNQDYESPLGY